MSFTPSLPVLGKDGRVLSVLHSPFPVPSSITGGRYVPRSLKPGVGAYAH